MDIGFHCSGNRGVRSSSKKNVVPKLLCVGPIKYFEVVSPFLDEMYVVADYGMDSTS